MPYITESPFSAVDNFIVNVNTTKSAKDIGTFDKGGNLNRSSIMKAAKDLTMSFPVICTDSIQPETAAMIVKAIERNCVTTLQLLFSATYLRGENGQEVIRKWHKNIDNDISMDDYLDLADSVGRYIDSSKLGSNIKNTTINKLNNKLNSFIGEGTYFTPKGVKMSYSEFEKALINENSLQGTYFPDSSFSKNSINVFEISESKINDGIVIRENLIKEDYQPRVLRIKAPTYTKNSDGSSIYDEDDYRWARMKLDNDTYNANQQERINLAATEKKRFDHQVDMDTHKLKREIDEDEYRARRDDINDALNQEKLKLQYAQDAREHFTKQLLDNDVRKCNELVPSMIIVRFVSTDAINLQNAVPERQFIAGVKAKLYPSSSQEIIEKITTVFEKRPTKVRWIKATTGEISFVKDFLLGLDKAKISEKEDKFSKVNPIWRHLKYRSTKSVFNRLRRKNVANDAGAITTLVITQAEVDYINTKFDINLSDVKNCKYLMEQYNFMGIVIVDENFEVARFYLDGDTHFQDYSFSSLEKETGDGSYKKVVNLISKINRG